MMHNNIIEACHTSKLRRDYRGRNAVFNASVITVNKTSQAVKTIPVTSQPVITVSSYPVSPVHWNQQKCTPEQHGGESHHTSNPT